MSGSLLESVAYVWNLLVENNNRSRLKQAVEWTGLLPARFSAIGAGRLSGELQNVPEILATIVGRERVTTTDSKTRDCRVAFAGGRFPTKAYWSAFFGMGGRRHPAKERQIC